MNIPRRRKRLVILDFDRNLLDTAALEEAQLGVFFEEFGIMPLAFKAETAAMTTDAEGYDLFEHLSRYGIDPSAAELLLRDRLGDQDFLFPGARRLVDNYEGDPDTDLVIVTTGRDAYQGYKLVIAKLDHISHYILETNKGEWLGQQWLDGVIRFAGTVYNEAIFFDDKFSSLTPLKNAPPSVRLVHVLRPGAKYPKLSGLDRVEVTPTLVKFV